MSYNICKVKNIDTVTHTYCGQDIVAGATYTIPDSERLLWAACDDLLDDISGGDAQIWDSSAAISGTSDQIDWLKDQSPREVHLCACGSIEKRLYKTVAADDTEQLDYTVTNGKTLSISEFAGNAATSTDVKVEIIWDPAGTPDILLSTHNDAQPQKTTKTFSGNGSKVMRVLLTNDSSTAETIGAYWIGDET